MICLLLSKIKKWKATENKGFQALCLPKINLLQRIIRGMRDCWSAKAPRATLFFCAQMGVLACSALRTCDLSDIHDWHEEHGSESKESLSLLFLFRRDNG